MSGRVLRVLVVESPAKAGTIKKYLGKDYRVVASYGHVRDLVAKQGGVDPARNFRMTYTSSERSKGHIAAIASAVAGAQELLLATDPDREGEAIAWHVLELMKERGLLEQVAVKRVVFHEITKHAVLEAVQNPRELSMDLVNAQLARRALDFLVGFNLSPLLWKKIRYGLSAGRVQSPALRLIVSREDEIANFKSQEYWHLAAELDADLGAAAAISAEMAEVKAEAEAKADAKMANGKAGGRASRSRNRRATVFFANLTHFQNRKLTQFAIKNAEQAEEYRQQIECDAAGFLTVSQVTRKERKRKPTAPFTTSTLQQEASRKLAMNAKRTMSVAQKLYEAGLITYMRTDSVSLASEAVSEIRALIKKMYGAHNLPAKPQQYINKSKNAQEAHEAIRPTHINNLPDELNVPLEQQKLYRLIWQRTVASQMAPAVFDTVTAELMAGDRLHLFSAHGSVLMKKGFLEIYQEGRDEREDGDGVNGGGGDDAVGSSGSDNDKLLPDLQVGQQVALLALTAKQHFTEPPPYYNEATLVKTLEAYGIGRPSTYATIIDTLLSREYVTLERRQFHPTDVGRVVNEFLVKYFTTYVDYDFTAHLEDKLDAVAKGEVERLLLLDEFWQPFKAKINEIDRSVSKEQVVQRQLLEENCPQCGRPLELKFGKKGKFISCSGFPQCNYAKPWVVTEGAIENAAANTDSGVDSAADANDAAGAAASVGADARMAVAGAIAVVDETGAAAVAATTAASATANVEIYEDHQCPKCQSVLYIRNGRYGRFIGCSNYPKCKHMEPLLKPKGSGVQCPQCKNGELVERRSKRGKLFYSCARYPECKYALWDRPIAECCPKCQHPVLVIKVHKKDGEYKSCPKEGCGWQEQLAPSVQSAQSVQSVQPAQSVQSAKTARPAKTMRPAKAVKSTKSVQMAEDGDSVGQ